MEERHIFDPFKLQSGVTLLENMEIVNREISRFQASIIRQHNCVYRVAQPIEAIMMFLSWLGVFKTCHRGSLGNLYL